MQSSLRKNVVVRDEEEESDGEEDKEIKKRNPDTDAANF